MALTTYSELKTSIADHLDRDELSSQIDDFIDLAEARHRRDIRIRDMLTRSQATLTGAVPAGRFLALPTDFLEMKILRLLRNAAGDELVDNILRSVNIHELTRLRRDREERPSVYTIHEEIEFEVIPDQNYEVEMIYYAAFEPLSVTAPTNALLARAPDAYLYGALVASAPFLMHDERIEVWGDLYSVTRDTLNDMDIAGAHTGPLVSRIDGLAP